MTILERSPAPLEEPTAPAATASPRRWKWTGDDLVRMGEAGLLPPEGRFELLDGEIYQIMPPGSLHAAIVDLVRRLLETLAWTITAHVRQRNPIRLSQTYDPQPDLAVVRDRERDYLHRFPGPADVLLVVEVADSSVEHDRERKLPAYAAAGIPECWLVNLPEQQVEVYREPAADGYRLRHLHRPGDSLAPQAAPGAALPVAVLLGQEETGAAVETGTGS
jgi:Uma2 family endonuclease